MCLILLFKRTAIIVRIFCDIVKVYGYNIDIDLISRMRAI